MATDEPSAQLHRELRLAVQSTIQSASGSPILHHLNDDTSWLIQIPRPENAVKHGARYYYNILLDPWFRGGQSDVASWFSQQFHATESAVQSIAELEELIREVEILAASSRPGGGRVSNGVVDATLIDAVTISHEFTDHCHKETLLELHPDVPVFAGKEAANLIESWKHFRSVTTLGHFGTDGDGSTDWRGTSLRGLPEWIGISRLLSTEDVLYYHSAILITFNNRHGSANAKFAKENGLLNGTRKRHHSAFEPDEDEEIAEAIIYTPHGIQSGDLALIPKAQPSISVLAFLHGLHNVRIGTVNGRTALQLNLGALNGLKAQRILHSKFWIGTHDEVKKGGGLVSWFLQREAMSLADALIVEKRARQNGTANTNKEVAEALDAFNDTKFCDLRNGESRILV
ncbi:hypothetical protein DOTSEDRAFT_70541 [Dothistroma septosporum NZE10]|uniref:Uncharacterized protein n=1 Tax=Dothistroma septosporum (strain NZE10 / CBS 128990) TaxID=675120 RepID=N1PSX5_DOTSN|nr:hypothetical protein DOTSEDRAFT_70541 [Dothistroma septosporum NZE10]